MRSDHDVFRLEIAVNDSLAVGEGHRLAHLAEDLHQLHPPPCGGRLLAEQRRQGLSLDQLHGVVRPAVGEPAHAVDRHDERMS
jgi:hypothetical protein